MPRGGKRPGAGRKPGSKDKATIEQSGTLSELARAHTGTALKVLVQVAETSASDPARVSAANAILDRGYGKPVQQTELTGKDGGPIQLEDMSDMDALRRVRFLMNKAKREQPSVN